jgi:hypothetical protein
MPHERKRKVPNLPIPNREDDAAAERKRILNVLAQRPYRKRKREHVPAHPRTLQLHREPTRRQSLASHHTSDSATAQATRTTTPWAAGRRLGFRPPAWKLRLHLHRLRPRHRRLDRAERRRRPGLQLQHPRRARQLQFGRTRDSRRSGSNAAKSGPDVAPTPAEVRLGQLGHVSWSRRSSSSPSRAWTPL